MCLISLPCQKALTSFRKLGEKRSLAKRSSAVVYQDTFLKPTHTLRAQKCVPKRIISRNTAPLVQYLAPTRSATAGRALTRRPFVDRIGNRRVTDDFVSAATSAATLGGLPNCPWRIKLAPRFRGASTKKKPKSPFYEERASTFCPPKKI